MPSQGFRCYCSQKHSWEQYCALVVSAPDWKSTRQIMLEHHSGVRLQYEWKRAATLLENPNAAVRRRRIQASVKNKQRALRVRLHRVTPNCFWCGRLTVLEAGQREYRPDLASVDHLYSRMHPERIARHVNARESKHVLHVLACVECNCERGTLEHQGKTFVPKLAERAEFARLVDATIARKEKPLVAATPKLSPETPKEIQVNRQHPAIVRTLEQEFLLENQPRKIRRQCGSVITQPKPSSEASG